MIEYLYNAIRATAGTPITITAIITDDADSPIEEGCSLVLHNDADMIAAATGNYVAEQGLWEFTLEPEVTADLCGRFWYCIKHNDEMLCFKEPIYLV
jgi:hypothetical protein